MLQRDRLLTLCLCVALAVSYAAENTTVNTNGQTTANAETTTVPQPTTTTPAPATAASEGSSQGPGEQGSSTPDTEAPTTATTAPATTAPSNSGDTNSSPPSTAETTPASTTAPTTTPTAPTTTDVNNCDSSPCHNNGNCTDTGNNTYNCSCPSEWLGETCDIHINDQCSGNPCGEYGFCQNLYGNYTCTCDDGNQGMTCSKPDLCSKVGPTCKTNEECEQVGSVATCRCKKGFHYRTPEQCEEILLFSPGNAVTNASNHGPFFALGGFPYYGKRYSGFYVNRNGYITLDRKWDLPYPVTNTTKWPQDVMMVAPLWWQWEVPESGSTFNIDSQHRYLPHNNIETLDEIEAAVNKSFPRANFVPDYALIATWMYVIPKPASQFAGFKNVTFQCTLATDGEKSYAIFAYRDLNIPASLPLVSGYSNGSNVFQTTQHVKWSRAAYALFDESKTPQKNDNYACLKTLTEFPPPQNSGWLSNRCPCVVNQAQVDPRFVFTEGDNCAVERLGSAQNKCCYDRTYGNLLIDTDLAGYPRYKNASVSALVQHAHDFCCGANSSLCKFFYKKVRSDNCTHYTKLNTMSLWGNPVSDSDPPVIFNGIGEYKLAGDNFQFIQGRYEEFSENITYLTAIVVQHSETAFEAVMEGNSVNFYQDGVPIANGLTTEIFALDNDTLVFPDGFSVEVLVHEQLLLNIYYIDSYFFEEGLLSVMKKGSIDNSKIESVRISNITDSKFNYTLTDVGNFSTISAMTIEPLFYTDFAEYMAALFTQARGDLDAANTTCEEDIACLVAYTKQSNQTLWLAEQQALLKESEALAISLPAFKTIESSWQLVVSAGEYTGQIFPAPNVTLSMQPANAVASYNSTTGDLHINLTTIKANSSFTFIQDGNGIRRSDSPALLVCSCPNSSQCDFVIPTQQESLSTGKYFEAVCECPPGYAGVRCETKLDACDQCYPGAQCNATDGSCTCPRGMEGDGVTCYEINDCLGSPCGENAQCKDLVGYYNCSCFHGYQNVSNQCVDINECTSKSHPCPGFVDEFRQYCQNLPGSCLVSCQPRFKGPNCSEKLEYVYGGEISFAEVRGKNQTWTDSLFDRRSAQFKALADKIVTVITRLLETKFPTAQLMVEVTSFYKGRPRQRRATEPADNIGASYKVYMDQPASTESLGEALDAGFNAAACPQNTSCPLGNGTDVLFGVNRLESSLADNVNLCESDTTNNCHKASTTCLHGNGTFSCQCRSGFIQWFEQDNVCKDIDECVNKTTACGDTALTCVNEPGSYRCTCQFGYEWTQDNKCVLTDHCRSGPCHNKASCVNTREEPGFACKCPYGYTGSTCNDEDAEVEKNKTIIIAVSASLGGLCFLLLVALCCVCSRQKKSDKTGRQAHYRLDEEEELPAHRTRIPRPQVRRDPDLEMVENLGSKTNLYMPVEEEFLLKERQESINKHTKFEKNPDPETESHHYTNLAFNGSASGEVNERL